MKNIIREISKDIAKEIITRPKFDVEEITEIVNFRIKESILEILLSNVEKEEANYYRLLIKQSNLKLNSREYVQCGYELAIAKKKKAIANRAVNNAKNHNKIACMFNFIRENYKDFDFDALYKYFDENLDSKESEVNDER